jgi:release factor glutamine methyltransferase
MTSAPEIALFPDTIAAELNWGIDRLSASTSPHLDAQLLLGHVLGRNRAWLLAHGEEPLQQAGRDAFRALIARRSAGEPVAYLRGHVDWLDLDLEIEPSVLVPRPESELLLEIALRAVPDDAALSVDVGTGSGALAIGMARARPRSRVIATDTDPAALRVARRNVEKYGLGERISLVHGDLVTSLTAVPDVIVANLPYLSAAMMEDLDQDVRHEPESALLGGTTGLELYGRLLSQIAERRWNVPCFLEFDPRQREEILSLIRSGLPPGCIRVYDDYAGLARVAEYIPERWSGR